jgi:hypothetical protein
MTNAGLGCPRKEGSKCRALYQCKLRSFTGEAGVPALHAGPAEFSRQQVESAGVLMADDTHDTGYDETS